MRLVFRCVHTAVSDFKHIRVIEKTGLIIGDHIVIYALIDNTYHRAPASGDIPRHAGGMAALRSIGP